MVRDDAIPDALDSGAGGGTRTAPAHGAPVHDPHVRSIDSIGPACRELFDGIADALLLLTPAGKVLHANVAACEMFGYGPDELSGQPVSVLYPPCEDHRVRAAFEELGVQRSTRYVNGQAKTRDGTVVPVDVVCSRVELAGRPTVIAVVRDIRERKQAEAALQAAQERFYLLAEHIREIFWISDPQSRRLLYTSPAFVELSGLSDSGADDLNRWARAVAPPDRPRFLTFLSSQEHGEAAEVEVRVDDRKGGIRWLRCRAFPWQAQDGHPRMAGVAEDITAHKQAEAHKLAQAERTRETLVREAHHRIKNSLQGVIGLLRRSAGQHPALAQALTVAISQVRSIAVLHELQSSQAQPVKLGELLRMIAGSIEGLFAPRFRLDVREVHSCNGRLADREAVSLAIVLNELLMNAVKHVPDGGNDERIGLRLHCGEGLACIVIDNRGTLPPGFDFAARQGLGQGLELLAALLPAEHAQLEFSQLADRVSVRLTLRPPIITFDENCTHAHAT